MFLWMIGEGQQAHHAANGPKKSTVKTAVCSSLSLRVVTLFCQISGFVSILEPFFSVDGSM
jgi:hypothetical protein